MTRKLFAAASVSLLAFATFLTQASWIYGNHPGLPNGGGGRVRRPDIPGFHSSAGTRAQVSASYGKLRLSFESNQGQMDGRVNFLSRGKGYNLLLSPNEAVLDLHRPGAAKRRSPGTRPE